MSDEPQQLLGPLSQSILRDFWKDRAGNWSMENIQKFIVGMSKPPWWRWTARWKWRKLARNMAKPQPALAGGKVIDPAPEVAELLKPASAKLTQDYLDGMYTYLKAQEPRPRQGLMLEVLPDPLPARYNSLDEAIADMKEGTRKRAIRPLEKVGDRVVQRREYRDALIGVGIVMCGEPYQIAYETKSPGDQETKNEETK